MNYFIIKRWETFFINSKDIIAIEVKVEEEIIEIDPEIILIKTKEKESLISQEETQKEIQKETLEESQKAKLSEKDYNNYLVKQDIQKDKNTYYNLRKSEYLISQQQKLLKQHIKTQIKKIKENEYYKQERRKILETNRQHNLIANLKRLKKSYENKLQLFQKYLKTNKETMFTLGEQKLLTYYLKQEDKYQNKINSWKSVKDLNKDELECLEELYRHLIRERLAINQIVEKSKQRFENEIKELYNANSWYNSNVKEKQRRTKKQMSIKEIYESLGYEKKEKEWILKAINY